MHEAMSRTHLVIAASAIAVLAAAFWMWSDTGPERSEAANEQVKTEMHLEIDGSLTGPMHCDSRTQTTCKLAKGSTFTLHVIPSAIPVGGYAGWQTRVDYGSLLYTPFNVNTENKWDIGLLAIRQPMIATGKEGTVIHGDVSAFANPFPPSFQKTSVVNLTFNCSENGQTPGQPHSNLLRLVDSNEALNGSSFLLADGSTTSNPNVSGLTIECNPQPTKQPDPADTDQDGCSDAAENGAFEYLGGQRNYLYFWDFYDVWTHPRPAIRTAGSATRC